MSKKQNEEVTAVAHIANHKGPSNPRFPGINMRKTADLLGIHKSFLSRTLRGECRASLGVSIRIAKAFGITVEELNSYYKPKEKKESHAKSKSSGRGGRAGRTKRAA